jgi:hypothetical protein
MDYSTEEVEGKWVDDDLKPQLMRRASHYELSFISFHHSIVPDMCLSQLLVTRAWGCLDVVKAQTFAMGFGESTSSVFQDRSQIKPKFGVWSA